MRRHRNKVLKFITTICHRAASNGRPFCYPIEMSNTIDPPDDNEISEGVSAEPAIKALNRCRNRITHFPSANFARAGFLGAENISRAVAC